MNILKSTPKKSAGEWRPVFIEMLRNSGNVRASCKQAGIDRKTAYKAREASEEFRLAWDEALEDAIDALEAYARDRAKKNSDTLLIFLLKAHRPAVYRETSRTLNITITAEELAKLSDDDLDKLERQLTTAR